MPSRRTLDLVLVAGACLLMFFFRLSGFGLVGADEPRYAQIAREMLNAHNWVTPVLYGHPWLEKPILYYWGAMISYSALGVSDLAARVPSAIFASGMIGFIYFAMGKIRPAARIDAALATATAALVLGMARAASTDMMLAAPFVVAMLAWYIGVAQRREKTARAWLAISYVALAIATLAKGPVAPFLALLIVVVYAALQRDRTLVTRTLWIPGILLFFAVAAPWYVLVQMRTPEFFRVFILQHNLGRFGSNMFRHKQPFWYYLPVALLATMPWTPVVVAAFVADIRTWWRERSDSSTLDSRSFERFLIVWIAAPILFFSLSQAKLPGYILPSIPPALILAADWIHRRAESQSRVPIPLVLVHAILLAGLAAALMMAPAMMLKLPATVQAMMLAGVLGTVIFVGVTLALLFRGWGMMRFATLVPMVLFISFILRALSPTIDSTQSARPVAQLVSAINQSGLPVATSGVKRDLSFGLAFYLNKPPIPYESLEVSPNIDVIPPSAPASEHIVVVSEKARATVQGEKLPVGFFRPQHLEIFQVLPR